MIFEIYQSVAPTLPAAALLVSVASILISWRNRSDQREALLLAKKTELLTKVAQRQAKVGHLILVCAQKLILLKTTYGTAYESEERSRLENNLAVNVEAQADANVLLKKIEAMHPKNLIEFETMLSTANQFLVFVTGELEKEQSALKDLQDAVGAS